MIGALELVASARELVGVPWKHLGRSERGVDCIGLVILAARRRGLDLTLSTGLRDRRYERKADPRLLTMICETCEPVAAPIAGALVLMRFDGEEHPRHFALLSDRETMIHAESRSRRQVVEHGYRVHWVRWTHSLWKLPGVAYE